MWVILMLPIERLVGEPFASIICYPRVTRVELEKRLRQLGSLGIGFVEFAGEKQVLSVRVLGKGCVGIVVLARRDRRRVALKVRRVDADRFGMQHEARMLERANSVGVGPKLLGASEDFLVMQFVEGDLFPTWLEKMRVKVRAKEVLREILQQCWRLDEAGLDHGELSHAPKHLIVDKRCTPFIVDFESASLDRRPANVTSVCQFLFISGIAEQVGERLGKLDRERIIDALKLYKKDNNRESFERLLSAVGV
jgi:putative serine/threonine protein kinase